MQPNLNNPAEQINAAVHGSSFIADDFRSHWNDNFAQGGDDFDAYSPAYLYGAGLTPRFSGRGWAEIEPSVRSDWEEQYPESTWERFKDAIRHGWEKATG